MANLNQAFPRLDTQAIDPQTGRWTQPWYRFIISLWTRSGSGTGYDIASIGDDADTALFGDLMGDISDIQPITDVSLRTILAGEEIFSAPDPIGILTITGDEASDRSVAGVQSLTVSASPVVFAPLSEGTLLIAGGTVTALAMTRAGVATTIPTSVALLPLSPADSASVTYTSAPTLTFIPR